MVESQSLVGRDGAIRPVFIGSREVTDLEDPIGRGPIVRVGDGVILWNVRQMTVLFLGDRGDRID